MSFENGNHYNPVRATHRQLILARRRVFVQSYLENGGDAAGALVEAGYPVHTRAAIKMHATKLFKTKEVQDMMRGMIPSRNGVEQDRIHEEIKSLVKEAKERYATARDTQKDSDPDRALKQEEIVNRRFQLLLSATELMLESCTKTLKARLKAGEKQGDEKVLNLTQSVIIVDRKSEEAKAVHSGAHDAFEVTPSRVVNAGGD